MHHVTRCHAHFVALADGVGSREAVSDNGFGLGRVSATLIKIKHAFHHRRQENTPSCFDKLACPLPLDLRIAAVKSTQSIIGVFQVESSHFVRNRR